MREGELVWQATASKIGLQSCLRSTRLCVMRVHFCGFRRFQALLRLSVVRFGLQGNPRLNLSSYPRNPRYSLRGLLTIGRNNRWGRKMAEAGWSYSCA
jgi:hypothetical protein